MAQLQGLFPLQLLFGVFWLRLLHITSTDQVSTRPGENVTLHCNTSNYWEISWYRLRAEEMKLLIFAKQGNLNKKFIISYNVNENQFYVTESGSLVIIDVKETDLGFYYCGAIKDSSPVQFGKPIRLNFTDDLKTGNSPEPSDLQQCPGTELWITRSVCVLAVLMNLVCMSVFCCRLTGKSSSSSSSSCGCWSTKGASEKGENIHYSSIQHKRKSRAAAKKHTPDSDSVTYATVASQPRRH